MPTRNVLLTRKSCKIINPNHFPGIQRKRNLVSSPKNHEAPSEISNNNSQALTMLLGNKMKLLLWSIIDRR
jgi:hypothetical protein